MEEETDMSEYQARLTRFHALSPEERIELASSLLRRDSKARRELGFEILRTKFPAASWASSRTRTSNPRTFGEGPWTQ
jgi:hypothetical protein